MSRPSPSAAAPAGSAAFSTGTANSAPELAELLRSVLLSVRNSPPEAASAQPLPEEAVKAIEQFRAIDASLRVPTVFPPAP
jgi:hypothetical protein